MLGAGAQTSAGQSFPLGFGWLGRVQDLFQPENCAANSSYDVSKSFAAVTCYLASSEGSSAPLFSDADLQRVVAMEQRASLLFGSPPQQPGPHTESSSIPHDAIQAEVPRQLAGMRQELENQMRRASQAEAELARLQSRFIEGAVAPPPPPPGGSGLLRLESTGLRGDSGISSGLPKASSPVPLIPQAPSGPLASLLSGLLGSRPRSQSPEKQRQEQALQ